MAFDGANSCFAICFIDSVSVSKIGSFVDGNENLILLAVSVWLTFDSILKIQNNICINKITCLINKIFQCR